MANFAGFLGPSYTAPSLYQNGEETINWYMERDPTKSTQGPAGPERGAYSMYPTPGRTVKFQSAVGEVRGLYPAQGATSLLAIIGNRFYTIDTSFAATQRGTLATSTAPIKITDNGQSAYFCDGINRYTFTYATNTFATVAPSDGGFVGGTNFGTDTVDGFILYTQPNSQNWGATSLNAITSPALSVGKKDGAPDNLVSIIVSNREVYLLGQYTTEVWSDTGGFPFPFARVAGTSTQHGLVAPASVSRLGNSFAYVSQDTRGQGIIVVMNNYSPQEISNHAVTNTLTNQYLGDALAFTYQIEGHEFYVVTFPSIDITWVYDASTQLWHKWQSMDSFGVFHRNRANCQALFNGLVLVGDYLDGSISALDNAVYTDNGLPIRRVRRCTHLVEDFNQQFFDRLQIQFQPGVGLITGQGSDPQVMLRWSDDGGSTFKNEHWRSIGQIGKYRNRAIWRKLGSARDRVFEVSISDPVKAVIISADLVASAGDN